MTLKWLINRTNKEYISYLATATSISPAIAQVLIGRGIKTPSDVKDFILADLRAMSHPSQLNGIKEAVTLIKGLKPGKKVLVWGDYDVDGITATAIMVSALRSIGLDTTYFIPNRFRDGYGFSTHAIKIARHCSADLIITVDCGITSFEAVEYIKKHGIDVIITDHHEPAESVPDALAIVNPRLEKASVSAMLSGAGIALKVAIALGVEPERFLDLAALGTLADVVPLIGENRLIVKSGLNLIRSGQRHGLKALLHLSGIKDKELKAEDLNYTVIPRLNAGGRISDAGESVTLLLTESEETAVGIAQSLDKKNSERQKIENTVYESAIQMLEKMGITKSDPSSIPPTIVLWSEGWHEGVIGIVAGRIAEDFYRPTFIFSVKDKEAKGSARSIPEFDIHKGLSICKELLISFGGHRGAAGLKIKVSDMNRFEEVISSIVEKTVKDFTPSIQVDAEIMLEEIKPSMIRELSQLEPFGYGNPEPFFGSKGLEIVKPRLVGNNHLKLKLKSKGRIIDAIGFDMGRPSEDLQESALIDAVYTINMNEWNGTKTPQLSLKALRVSI